jgi:hypothetical protein
MNFSYLPLAQLPEEGDIMFLRKVDKLLPTYAASYARKYSLFLNYYVGG